MWSARIDELARRQDASDAEPFVEETHDRPGSL